MKPLILFITIIIIVYNYFNQRKTHKFWDKQPVSKKGTIKNGIISKLPYIKIIVNDEFKFKYLKLNSICDFDIVFKFINEHFSENYIYNKHFLKQTLLYNGNGYNLGIFFRNTLIGFIHTKPSNIIIFNKKYFIYYVDFLCVHKKYRNRNLAAILISKVINDHYGKTKFFIFKKENKSLPFNYITKTNYYYLNLNFVEQTHYNKKYINIQFSDNDPYKIYNFINSISQKGKIYQKLNKKMFLDNFNSKHKKYLIEYDSNRVIKNVIIFIELNFNQSNIISKTIDIENIYLSSHSTNIFDYLINYCLNKKIEIISCLDIADNYIIINKYKMLKSMPIYYHMYNFHIKDIIKKNDIFINYL